MTPPRGASAFAVNCAFASHTEDLRVVLLALNFSAASAAQPNGTSGSELAVVETARCLLESKMGGEAAAVAQKNLPTELQRAANFVPGSH